MEEMLYKKRKGIRCIKRGLFMLFVIMVIIIVLYVLLSDIDGKQNNTTPVVAVYDNQSGYNIANNKNNNYMDKNRENVDINNWKLILVNKNNYLDENYKCELKTLSSGHKIDKRAYEDLQNMMDDARAQGLKPIICSSYRTKDTQSKLYDNEVKDYQKKGYWINEAKEMAAMWVAPPGTSEHQTGLALDIVALSYQLLNEQQEHTAEQKWLIQNSYKYGFVLRYPTNKKNITGIEYEPWHYRYVGVEHAKIMKENNFVLEEYIDYLKTK